MNWKCASARASGRNKPEGSGCAGPPDTPERRLKGPSGSGPRPERQAGGRGRDDESEDSVTEKVKLILASGSPRRLALLNQAGIEPDLLMPAEIDETPEKGELPRKLALRLAEQKGELVARRAREAGEKAIVVSADTVVAVGRRVLPKPDIQDEADYCLRLLSGRTHRVFTGLCVVSERGRVRTRLVETRLRFRRLSGEDIAAYLACGEWRGKAGGYAIQGIAGSFVVKLVGSYTSVVGLPLSETVALLNGEGYPVRAGWAERAA
ncbi:MAG: septum formation protein Maf [Rhizobiales bacterium 17-65-6]|nr:MAG: septum formation protein Maf [Azorhizobium sp. 32-67-21]OYZ98185.1 MAG: septum formation protein Maf [Rhizobiales bacterium 17-65-6]